MNNTHEKDRDIISSSQTGQDLQVIDTLNFKKEMDIFQGF